MLLKRLEHEGHEGTRRTRWTANGLSISGNYSRYQWFLNGSPINGAVQDTFVPQFSGNYTVEVVYQSGCVIRSLPIRVDIITGAQNPKLSESALRVSPNPFSESVYLSYAKAVVSPEPVLISIRDMNGKQMVAPQSLMVTTLPAPLDLSMLDAGLYLLQVVSDKGVEIVKVLKQNRH